MPVFYHDWHEGDIIQFPSRPSGRTFTVHITSCKQRINGDDITVTGYRIGFNGRGSIGGRRDFTFKRDEAKRICPINSS